MLFFDMIVMAKSLLKTLLQSKHGNSNSGVCIENFPNQMRCLHFCQFYVELHATFLRSFNFNCFRTLI